MVLGRPKVLVSLLVNFAAFLCTASISIQSCSRNFSGTPNGTIHNSGYSDNYGEGELCNYAITVGPGKQVKLSVENVSFAVVSNRLFDFILLFDGADCMANRTAVIFNMDITEYFSSSNKMTALFTSDFVLPAGRFTITYEEVADGVDPTKQAPPFPGNKILENCGQDLNGESGNLSYIAVGGTNQLCIWRISVSSGRMVRIEFMRILIRRNWIRVLDGKDCGAKVIYFSTGETRLLPPMISSSNSIIVMLSADADGAGFEATYTSIESTSIPTTPSTDPSKQSCSRNFSGTGNRTIHNPGYPGNYSNGEFCNYAITVGSGKKVKLSVENVSLDIFDDQLFDFILLFDGADCMANRTAVIINMNLTDYNFSSNKIAALFSSDTELPVGWFTITYDEVTDNVTTKQGPPFPGNKILEQCGQELKGESGNISYTAVGGPNELCIWRISVGDGRRVRLELTSRLTSITGNWLRVLDGGDCGAKTIYFTLNGISVAPQMTSSDNSLLVVFSANRQGDGIEATYSSIESTPSPTTQSVESITTPTTLFVESTPSPTTQSASWLTFHRSTTVSACLFTVALRFSDVLL